MQKWASQNAVIAKRCLGLSQLRHILASATITQSVLGLTKLVIGNASYVVADADSEQVKTMKDVDKHLQSICDIAFDEYPSFSNESKHSLQKGELLEAPSQLNQYYMMVRCDEVNAYNEAATPCMLCQYENMLIILQFVHVRRFLLNRSLVNGD
jgi:hypothetical protein